MKLNNLLNRPKLGIVNEIVKACNISPSYKIFKEEPLPWGTAVIQ